MPLTINGTIIKDSKFSYPWRMILSGSSESGKTHFARKLLQQRELFTDSVNSIIYHYPCYLEDTPVKWHNELDIPVSYKLGLPTKQELINLPSKCCVVLDDLYDEAIKSDVIDHLFRVISGKKKICVMIMTQNNFTQGKYGRDIRNSCNYSVLFRNCCDSNINKRVTTMAGLGKAYTAASRDQVRSMYPYMFIDQSQQGQLSCYRLYTDIFSEYKTVYSFSGMKGYVVGETDFLSVYKTIENGSNFEAKLIKRNHDHQEQRGITNHSTEPYEFSLQTSSEESNSIDEKAESSNTEVVTFNNQVATPEKYLTSREKSEFTSHCSDRDSTPRRKAIRRTRKKFRRGLRDVI